MKKLADCSGDEATLGAYAVDAYSLFIRSSMQPCI